MSRRNAGEVLQRLFRDHDEGRIGRAEFERRKARILDLSGGRLTVPLPGPIAQAWHRLMLRLSGTTAGT